MTLGNILFAVLIVIDHPFLANPINIMGNNIIFLKNLCFLKK